MRKLQFAATPFDLATERAICAWTKMPVLFTTNDATKLKLCAIISRTSQTVLHGTDELPDSLFQECVKNGVTKVS